MNVEECYRKKLLKKITPDALKAQSSLRIAELKLERAKKLFSEDFFSEAFVTAYTSMFHAARTLLYKDGVQEKGHYAVYAYLSEKYAEKISRALLEAFYAYQGERHKLLYGFDDTTSKEQATSILEDAEALLQEVRKLYGTL